MSEENVREGIMNVTKVFCPLASMVFLVTVWMLPGCAQVEVVRTTCNEGKIRVAMADRRNDTLAVRLSNHGTDPMFVRWKEAHMRWPNGYEAPVEVRPENALASIYPGGTVEYHVRPSHTYAPPDRFMYRRHSLTQSLVPKELYEVHANDYTLTLFLPVCKAPESKGEPAAPHNCVLWNVKTTLVKH